MNKRLQELYLVASEQFKIVQDQGLPAPYQTRAFAEKFAELIVRECAKEVARQNHNNATTEWEEGYEAGFQTAVTVILKHFGVEE